MRNLQALSIKRNNRHIRYNGDKSPVKREWGVEKRRVSRTLGKQKGRMEGMNKVGGGGGLLGNKLHVRETPNTRLILLHPLRRRGQYNSALVGEQKMRRQIKSNM